MVDANDWHRQLIIDLENICSCSKEKAEDIFKDLVVIEYAHRSGGSFSDTKFWMATINYEVEDYHTKGTLIIQAEEMGRDWIVLRHHKNVTRSIVQSSLNLNNTQSLNNNQQNKNNEFSTSLKASGVRPNMGDSCPRTADSQTHGGTTNE